MKLTFWKRGNMWTSYFQRIVFLLFISWISFVQSQACDENPCENGGSCTPDGNTFSCTCTKGFSGFYCDQVVPNSPPRFTSFGDDIDLVSEDTLPGAVLYTFTAEDEDGDTIAFLLEDGPGADYFSVDSISGELILEKELDFETELIYSLIVGVRDETNQTTTTEVFVFVSDINDNVPLFDDIPYIVSVPEDTPVGATILTISATDADSGVRGIVSYSIENITSDTNSEVLSNLFSLSSSGKLTLESNLDFEVAKQYLITVLAKDGGRDISLNSTTVVTVTIIDLQDSPPVFLNSSYNIEIPESMRENTIVLSLMAFDQDRGNPNDINYSIREGNELSFFVIDSTSGDLFLIRRLDRESANQPAQFTLTVRAYEVLNPGSYVETTFNITILDEVDENPSFDEQTYLLKIPEEEPPGTELSPPFIVSDGENTAHVVMRIELIGADNFPFELTQQFLANGGSTSLRTKETLDFEEASTYFFLMNASKTNPNSNQIYSTTATVIVQVEDINDNIPQFTQDLYEATLSEGLDNGTEILTVFADDRDTERNFSTIVYSFGTNQQFSNLFTIDRSSGTIRSAVVFDRESHPSEYLLFVLANNPVPLVGNSPGTDTAVVRITLQDANDNPPVFGQKTYTTCVLEEAGPLVVLNVSASDLDDGQNSQIDYFIVSGNEIGLFTIGQNTGSVSLRDSLDREVQATYNLTILARDRGEPPMTGTASLSVCVQDINDNDPQWVTDLVIIQLPENSDPGEIGQVEAFDTDEGRNAALSYQIAPGNPNFAIEAETGVISLVGTLDREVEPIINITVVVRDGGIPQRSSANPATVSIVLMDINDNDPVFSSSVYEFSIAENYKPSILVEVGRVMAMDIDTGIVTSYSFVNPLDFEGFTMNPNSGAIVTSLSFDREEKALYEGEVRAQDGRRDALAFVRITIRDVNDNAPVFDEGLYIGVILEGTSASTILSITATDHDEGGNGTVTYSFESGEQVESPFFLNPETGALSTTASLDREQQGSYEFRVQARDNPEYGDPMISQVAVTVIVLDINDNPPVFGESLYVLEIAENVTKTDVLIQISATDEDDGTNGVVNYRIAQGNVGNTFVINKTSGIVRAAQPLDRETVASYTLVVEAYNPNFVNSTTSIVSVLISILDVNDELPQFSQDIYSRPDLLETSPSGTAVITVMARDSDTAEGGQVVYSIVGGNSDNLFAIDQSSGLITTADFLPQVTDSITFNLTVEATDRAPPFQTARATVFITVVQSLAITPVFLQDVYNVNLTENLPPNSSVVQVGISDSIGLMRRRREKVKASVNGRLDVIKYSLDPFNPQASMYFHIDEISGLIRTRMPIDREEISFIAITANAKNGDSGFGSTAVWITVVDVNDNSPVFENIVENLVIREGLPPDTVVSDIKTTDADLGQNALVTYNITSGNIDDAFAVVTTDNVTYTLITTKSLDREAVASYHLTVKASDQGIPALESFLEVDVSVGDVNDNAPDFSQISYTAVVPEETFTSEPILSITVNDSDLPESNSHMFSFISGNEESKFSITGGELIQTNLFDREERDFYVLEVLLRDPSYDVNFEKRTTINVSVSDINDNPPIFSPMSYSVNVTEGAPPARIVTVFASDDDLLANSNVTFSLAGPYTDLFSIDLINGSLSTLQPLDRETRSLYTLTIMATDNPIDAQQALTGSATVTVSVIDVNDSPPLFAEDFLGPFEVKEGASGYYIQSISAVDPDDISSEITYSLTGPNIEYFDLDGKTGVLTTKIDFPLDYETLQEFNITIIARDESNLQSSVIVGISVINENDNDPFFLNAPYNLTLKENSTVGLVKFVVAASDPDLGPEGEITYKITSGNINNTFWIAEKTGEIYLNQSLDRESMGSYNLILQVSDNPPDVVDVRSATTTLTVTVSDIDDSPPLFTMTSFVGSLSESALIDTPIIVVPPIMAVDADSGSLLLYSLMGNDSLLFTINPQTGELRTASMLDFESQQIYQFKVLATDSRGRFATANVTIQVKNENDNAPEFVMDTFNLSISENSVSGTFVGAISAMDADGDSLRFALIQGAEGQFVLDPFTGYINVSTGASLDREDKGVYTLRVSVTDLSFTTESLFYVSLSDINDSPPTFLEPEVSIVLGEDYPLLKSFYVIVAQDLDDDAVLAYFIEQFIVMDTSGVDISSTVNIFQWLALNNTTGDLFLNQAIDREMFSLIILHILAIDVNGEEGTDSSDPTFKINIEIGDVNDNVPQFLPSNATVLIFEAQEETAPNTIIATLQAVDVDDGLAGEVRFSIAAEDDASPVLIESETGNVRIRRPIDREESPWVNFTAVASDRGQPALNSTIPVAIQILDINDNNPVFEESMYRVMVNESRSVGDVVAKVTATDPDEGEFGRVGYSMSGGSGVFTIDYNSGEIVLQSSLDRETINEYVLTIFAQDNPEGTGPNKRESSVLVVIDVTDANEFAPEPSMTTFLFSVPAESVPGSEIGRIDATDPDNTEQKLMFAVESSDPPDWERLFSINATTGQIFLILDINDRNVTFAAVYRLQIEISDGGIPAKTTIVETVISFMDAMDNPPVFEQSVLNISIPEDFSTGLPIAILTAVDPDDESDVIYLIVNQEENQFQFTISVSGELRFIGTLDHETKPFYTVIVRASDQDKLEANATVNIVITDVNDQPPIFLQEQYEFAVMENEDAGTFVGNVSVEDEDSDPLNQETAFSIISGDSEFLTIDAETGDIKLLQSVDREMRSTLAIRVEARNTRTPPGVDLRSRTDVAIMILDVNDNAPIFEESLYEEAILETAPAGSFILEVAASDEDEGVNGLFTFDITEGNELGLFRVDNDGRVFVNQSVANQYMGTQQIILTITATDQGAPSMAGSTLVVLNITDTNNNPPVFVSPSPGEFLEVPENEAPGYLVVTVEAEDIDFGINGEVTYSLLAEGLESPLFSINSDTGELFTNFTADREVKAVYEIILQASDKGENQLMTAMRVEVMITDENDNEPAFLRLGDDSPIVQILEIPENSNVSTLIGKITPAVDSDSGDNAVVYYYIVAGNEQNLFRLDPLSGEIYIAKSPDREEAESHLLIVKATNDPSYPVTPPPSNARLSFDVLSDKSLKEVLITITDLNDNGPTFLSKLLTIGISRSDNPVTKVLQLEVYDPDSTGAENAQFIIKSANFVQDGQSTSALDWFMIDSGQITTRKTFEMFHTTGYFDIIVEALDPETKLSDNTMIRVYVLDSNQEIILVIDSPPSIVIAREEELIDLLSDITGGSVQVDDISRLITDGVTDDTQTMVTFYVIDPDTNLVLDADYVISKIDESSGSVENLFLKQHVREVYPKLSDQIRALFGTLGISLLAIAILLLFGTTLFIIILCCLRWRPDPKEHERYLRMLTGGIQSGVLYRRGSIRADLNHTEITSFDGSNPAFDYDGSLGDWPASRSDIAGREALETTTQFLSEEIASSAPGDVIMTNFVSEKALKGDYTQRGRYISSRGSPPGSGKNMLGSLNSLRSEGSGASVGTAMEMKTYGAKAPTGNKKGSRGSISTAQAAQTFADYQLQSERRGSLLKIDENEETFKPREEFTTSDSTAEIRRILEELTDDGKPSPSGISYDSATSHAAMEAYRDQLDYDNELTPITENDEDAVSTLSSRRGSEKHGDPSDVSDLGSPTHQNTNKKSGGDHQTDPNQQLAVKISPTKAIYEGKVNSAPKNANGSDKPGQKSKQSFKKYQPMTDDAQTGHAAIVKQLSNDSNSHTPVAQTSSNVSEEDNRLSTGRVLIEDSSDDEESSSSSDDEVEGLPGLENSRPIGKNSGFYEVQSGK
ncbi:Cadherin-23 [Holothuria leucospilota]|uniref:Cadherin-23 n=1 Tax=Holothuria leucospilota TaxID=206669 RepID=A0A9Q0YLH1_HOLLE|nr:Cadherin-23 [Holothuria leucospilota]